MSTQPNIILHISPQGPQDSPTIGGSFLSTNTVETYQFDNIPNPDGIVHMSYGDAVYYFSTVYSYTLVVFFSLLINIFFILILTFGMQSYKRPFYRIVWQLILANLLKSIANASTTIPVTFFLNSDQSKVFGGSSFYKVANFIDTAGDQLVVWVTLLIAVSRLCVFVFPNISDKIFSGKILNILIVLAYSSGFAFSLMMNLNGCNYKFIIIPTRSYEGYFQFTCPGILNRNHWKLIEGVLIGQSALFPFLGFICYLILFIEIARRRNGWKNIKTAEVEILKQAILLFVAFEYFNEQDFNNTFFPISIAFGYVFMAVSTITATAYSVKMIITTVELIAAVVTPLFFFITSKEIRDCAGRLNPLRVHISVSFTSKKVTQLKSTSSSLSGSKSRKTISLFHSVT